MRTITSIFISLCFIQALAGTIPGKRQQLSNVDSTISILPPTMTNFSEITAQCFDVGEYHPTNVDTCRPLLTKIRAFDKYRTKQTFQMYKTPKSPFEPPFGFTVRKCTCELRVKATGLQWVDKFSWEEVRAMATNIVEDCQPPRGAGVGGWDLIGPEKRWIVEMIGIIPHDNEARTGVKVTELDDQIIIDGNSLGSPFADWGRTSVS